MNKTRKIFYIVTGLYIILSIIFIIARDNFFDRMGILAYTNFIQFWLIVGLIFLILMIIVSQIEIRRLQSRNKILEGEVAKIKVVLYDIEHKTGETDQSLKAFGNSIKSDQNKPDKPDQIKPDPNKSDENKPEL